MSGRYKAVPTGTIANGKPVLVNSAGTVSEVTKTTSSSSSAAGTPVVFESATTFDSAVGVTFDSNSNKIVIAYKDGGNSNYGTAIVGTVDASDNSISFGTPAVFASASTNAVSSVFDSSNNKVVIAYADSGNSNKGTAIVATVSGTSISFGSEAVFETGAVEYVTTAFDSSNNKVVITYKDSGNSSYGTAVVATVSGTSVSFGTPVVFLSGSVVNPSTIFDSNANKTVTAYRNASDANDAGTAIVGTVSGTSISFGTPAVFENNNNQVGDLAFDSNSNKVVIPYVDNNVDGTNYGTVVIGTVSGTNITFGTPVTFATSYTSSYLSATFDSSSNKVLVVHANNGSSYAGTAIVGTVSGTSISFGTAFVYTSNSAYTTYIGRGSVFDSNSNRVVATYVDGSNSNYGTAVVISTSETNLTASTSEGYIGLSNACSFHGATETYTVTVASGVFYLNGLANPPIQLLRGHTYIFDQADGTNDGHPFHFKDTGGSQYTSGVTVTGTAGTSGANVTIVVPIDATEPSQYYCTVHGNGMGNVITIEESFAEIDVVGTVNKHQSGLTAGQTYYVQTDGTLGTSADSPSVIAGTAISATEIIVKG
tara:strand:- start:2423 stop:4207 length:1785 start_codon:yes stop_codon:yes gene_type:complete